MCSDTRHPYPIAYTSTTPRGHLLLLHPPYAWLNTSPLTPGVLSRGRVRRLEYTVGAITNALFFVENEGWY